MEKLGGAPVPESALNLRDLAVTGPQEILAISRQMTRDSGGILMSSGGTTGRPKLTFVAYHQALERLRQQWRPIGAGDTMLNLFTPGRLWASHYYMQALAEFCGADVVPAGPYEPAEAGDWAPMFRDVGVNAVCGTPTALADLARGVLDAGETLPLTKLIWMAEPWTDAKEALVRTAFPGIEFWGNYGSVETYVIATNTPDCDATILHLMPDQMMEPDDGGALLTRIGSGWTVPTVRYRLGDRITAATCRCGRPGGLRVLGRADDAIKLHGALIGIGDLIDLIHADTRVTGAQLILTRSSESSRSVAHLAIHITGSAPADDVHRRILRQFYDLGVIDAHHPGAITTRLVPELGRVARTNKVPPMLWLDPPTPGADR